MFLLLSARILSNVKVREHEDLLDGVSVQRGTLRNLAQYVQAVSYQHHDVRDGAHRAAEMLAVADYGIRAGPGNHQQGCGG